MRHMKKYILLLLALALCLLALWGCGEKAPDEQQPDESDPQQSEEIKEPTILSDVVECSDGNRTLRFQRNEKGEWEWKDDTDFPLDTSYVKALLTTVEEMLALQPIETDKTLEDLDLDDDESKKYVTASNEKGETITWYLGKKDDNGCYYMRLANDQSGTVYLSPAGLGEQIGRSIYDMMVLPQLPAIKEEDILSITLHAGDITQQLNRNSEGRWFSALNNVTPKVRALASLLSGDSLLSCADFKPSKGAPAICGLDPAAAVITIEYEDLVDVAHTLTLSVGKAYGEGYYVTIDEDTTIYLMDAATAKAILSFVQ